MNLRSCLLVGVLAMVAVLGAAMSGCQRVFTVNRIDGVAVQHPLAVGRWVEEGSQTGDREAMVFEVIKSSIRINQDEMYGYRQVGKAPLEGVGPGLARLVSVGDQMWAEIWSGDMFAPRIFMLANVTIEGTGPVRAHLRLLNPEWLVGQIANRRWAVTQLENKELLLTGDSGEIAEILAAASKAENEAFVTRRMTFRRDGYVAKPVGNPAKVVVPQTMMKQTIDFNSDKARQAWKFTAPSEGWIGLSWRAVQAEEMTKVEPSVMPGDRVEAFLRGEAVAEVPLDKIAGEMQSTDLRLRAGETVTLGLRLKDPAKGTEKIQVEVEFRPSGFP
jgi:hypothetical protein